MSEVVLDLTQEVPAIDEESDEILEAIDRGIQAADRGETVPLEEVEKLVAQWLTKSNSLNQP